MTERIAVIASTGENQTLVSAWECFAFARQMAGHLNAEISFVLVGEKTKETAEHLSARTGCPALSLDLPGTKRYHGELVQRALNHIFKQAPHTHIVAPHSTSGMDYGPALALGLGGTCISAVEGVNIQGGPPGFVRSMFNGKIQAVIQADQACASSPLVVTLQPGAVKPEKPDLGKAPRVRRFRLDLAPEQMRYQGTHPSLSQGSNLAKAKVIVSGGRGIEDEENYQLIRDLASIFPRAATGASRPICDYGWASYASQVGATGVIVSPKLYIACGISGATQHLEGIRDARFIVAVNKDPMAPIFKIADLCVVEDLVTFIPLVRQAWEEKKNSPDS